MFQEMTIRESDVSRVQLGHLPICNIGFFGVG